MFFASSAPTQASSILDRITGFLVDNGPDWSLRILAALAIFFIGRWVARLIARILVKALDRGRVDATLGKFLARVLQVFLLVVVVLAVLDTLGVHTTSLVAVLGAAGITIGLALQSSLSNFAAGVMLVVFRFFKVGDSIEVGSIAGAVEEIGMFTTSVRTGDNRLIVVPNSTFISNAVTNVSAKTTRRIDLIIGISYNDDIKIAKEIIHQVLAADDRVLYEPSPTIGVANLGESSVDIAVRPWVRTSDYWSARCDLLEKIKTELEAGGCSIPYPQRDVHIFQTNEK